MTHRHTEAARTKATLVFVSHDASLASQFGRTLELGDLNRAATLQVV